MARTIAGFEAPTAGTFRRGARERARQDEMIQRCGGIVAYMRGCSWHGNSMLTDDANCVIMLRDKHNPETPGTAV